jgi:HPt (histidine-containing phosphotransfer) domain-containing protein
MDSTAATDLTYLAKFCEGNKEKMQKYIDLFLKSMPVVTEKITTALSSNDFIEIANQVHSCKTKFTMMGMNQAYQLSQTIENECRNGNINGELKEDISTLLRIIPQAETELKNHSAS